MLFCRFISAEAASQLNHDPHTLALIHFGDRSQTMHGKAFQINLPAMTEAQVEHWYSDQRVQQRSTHGFELHDDGDWLFGVGLFHDDAANNPHDVTHDAYTQLQTVLNECDFPYLLRTWNYLPSINEAVDGTERYRSFVSGRYEALNNPKDVAQFPAATAIGTHNNGLLVYFIASKKPPQQVENPRQTSAFHYPENYGPRSPSFSRATKVSIAHQTALFISGTASIVGHESKHDDACQQAEEIFNNLQALIESSQIHGLSELHQLNQIKVYLRNSKDSNDVRKLLQQRMKDVPLLIVQGDVCRSDLLIEMEALYLSDNHA